ncbi:protein of unknown function [Legionella fallonii LLAP-10]|uniref:Uncharacterized protein n=1 Tax=Legionella fallonii LLAP-10 TaxID=1212491 RepID=A0A098G9E3_9GAMM|nr:protein of unknown function [Legionella fallonii LLAP-10]
MKYIPYLCLTLLAFIEIVKKHQLLGDFPGAQRMISCYATFRIFFAGQVGLNEA